MMFLTITLKSNKPAMQSSYIIFYLTQALYVFIMISIQCVWMNFN